MDDTTLVNNIESEFHTPVNPQGHYSQKLQYWLQCQHIMGSIATTELRNNNCSSVCVASGLTNKILPAVTQQYV